MKAWCARFDEALAKERQELTKQRIIARLTAAIKAEIIQWRQKAEQTMLAKAKAAKRAAKARIKAALVERDEMLEKAATVQAQTSEIAAALQAQVADMGQRVAATTQDADNRITRILAVLDQYNAEQAMKGARRAAFEAKRVERERDEWMFKASTTNDPVLRAVYLVALKEKRLTTMTPDIDLEATKCE